MTTTIMDDDDDGFVVWQLSLSTKIQSKIPIPSYGFYKFMEFRFDQDNVTALPK